MAMDGEGVRRFEMTIMLILIVLVMVQANDLRLSVASYHAPFSGSFGLFYSYSEGDKSAIRVIGRTIRCDWRCQIRCAKYHYLLQYCRDKCMRGCVLEIFDAL
jgi:hypothetical protein